MTPDSRKTIDRSAARALLDLPLPELMASARELRELAHGANVQFCAIVNAKSGACSQDCAFCAQSVHHHTEAAVHALLPPDEILARAGRLDRCGITRIGIVTSGPALSDKEIERIAAAIRLIDTKTELLPCASLGCLKREHLETLAAAGLVRYHHNLETSERFYPSINTTGDWRQRYETVRAALDCGLEVCCGGLFGLGESWEDRIELALTLRELGIDSVPLNFLDPIPGTPLEDTSPLTADEALRLIALYRHLLPAASLRVCGGRARILGRRAEEIFAAGVNALMTGDYLTTSGISPEADAETVRRLGFRTPR